MLVDPDLRTYQLLGFLHAKFPVLIDLRGAPAAARALAKGILQGRTAGDPQQQGGVVVVAKGGTPTWFYASQYVGDMPSVAEVLEKARAAAGT